MDRINPKYYKEHPSGVECIDIARHYCFRPALHRYFIALPILKQ